MKIEEHQKIHISGRMRLFDLPETAEMKGEIQVNHETGESKTVYQAGFSEESSMLFYFKPLYLPENNGGEN